MLVNGGIYSFLFPNTIILKDERLRKWYEPVPYTGIFALSLAIFIVLVNLNLMKRERTQSFRAFIVIVVLVSGFFFLFQIVLIIPATFLLIAGGTMVYSMLYE